MEALLLRLSDLQHWEIAALASYLLLQGFAVTVFPEEVIITTLGLLWSQNRIGFFEALVAVWVGLLPANSLAVFIGGKLGPKLLNMRPFIWVLNPVAITESLARLRRHGTWIVFLTRFIPLIRGPVYWSAGLSQMRVIDFFRADFLASCIQVPALLFLGSMIGKNSGNLIEGYQRIGMLMLIMIVGVLTGQALLNWRRRRNSSLQILG